MFWIKEYASMRSVKDALGFFKPDGVLASIAPVLLFVPLKPKHIYMLSIYPLTNKQVRTPQYLVE